MTIKILPINAFNDNYIWIIVQGNDAVVIDPGQAGPVLAVLQEKNLDLRAILVTHHHADHVGGIAALLEYAPATVVYGPAHEAIPFRDVALREGDVVKPDGFSWALSVLEVPGHTLGHIAYFGQINQGQPVLFCGDTLFATGCGRIFEGNSTQMHQSIDKFRKLPQNTLVFCAHEYTLGNIKWALEVEKGNPDLQQWSQEAQAIRNQGKPTVPTTVAHECKTNPFMRVAQESVIKAAQIRAGRSLNAPDEVFAVLRDWKNNF
ncbi:MAG: hydroxyacylglutathione hydrolase [Alcaligenaceae bacterium]|nr:hydroxyacylglutathione hydrolase [Alcaligenaceae bacterium]